MLLTSVAV